MATKKFFSKETLLEFIITFFLALTIIGAGTLLHNALNKDNKSETPITVNDPDGIIVRLVVTKNNGQEVVGDMILQVTEGSTVMDITKDNFDVTDGGGFLTEINNIEQDGDNEIYWFFTVNGQIVELGATEVEVKEYDFIQWDLHSWK